MGDDDGKRWRLSGAGRVLFWLVLVALGLALLVLFVADNFVLVEIRLFTLHRQVRLAWALIVAFAVGSLVGALVATLRR